VILYLDTSALLKKYVKETWSDEIIDLWKQALGIATSSVAYAEAMASLYRKKREEKVPSATFRKLLHSFREDWHSFIRVDVTQNLNTPIDKIVKRYPLRGFDAIHLASAILIHERMPSEFLFACFDRSLVIAATQNGLQTFPSTP
jgi:predicted nucleic acid-binding protein